MEELTDEMMEQITGGNKQEWLELKEWALRHNPKWAGKTVDQIGDGPVIRYLYTEIPEYGGSACRGDEPADYFVNGAEKRVMNHKEFMTLLNERHGS